MLVNEIFRRNIRVQKNRSGLKGINSAKSVTKSGVVLVVSFFYESPHVTSKCDYKAIANIFAGLEIAEVVL